MSKTGNNKLTFLVIFKLTFLVKIILTILLFVKMGNSKQSIKMKMENVMYFLHIVRI